MSYILVVTQYNFGSLGLMVRLGKARIPASQVTVMVFSYAYHFHSVMLAAHSIPC